jgi:Transglycosylase SLT domain
MRRKATAAALSAGLLVLVPNVQAQRAPARPAPAVVGTPVLLPIPSEAPAVAPIGTAAGAWSTRFADAPATAVSLPSAVLAAYQHAVAVSPPECHLTVALLAAIGQVESGNLNGHHLDSDGRVVPAILGPVLDGRAFTAVADTDGGEWDGNRTWDRALGPLQFIPATWRAVGVDLDGDGVRDPQDLEDAAGAAMVYLCAGGRDLATEDGLRSAILSYNHSEKYLRLVLAWKAAFDGVDLATWTMPLYNAWSAVLTAPADPGSSSAPAAHHQPRPTPPPAMAAPQLTVTVAGPTASVTTPSGPAPVEQATQPFPEPGTIADPPTPPAPAPCPVPDPAPVPAPTDPAPAPPDPNPTPTPTVDPAPVPGTQPDPCAPPVDPSPAPDPAPDPVPDPAPDSAPVSTP